MTINQEFIDYIANLDNGDLHEFLDHMKIPGNEFNGDIQEYLHLCEAIFSILNPGVELKFISNHRLTVSNIILETIQDKCEFYIGDNKLIIRFYKDDDNLDNYIDQYHPCFNITSYNQFCQLRRNHENPTTEI